MVSKTAYQNVHIYKYIVCFLNVVQDVCDVMYSTFYLWGIEKILFIQWTVRSQQKSNVGSVSEQSLSVSSYHLNLLK